MVMIGYDRILILCVATGLRCVASRLAASGLSEMFKVCFVAFWIGVDECAWLVGWLMERGDDWMRWGSCSKRGGGGGGLVRVLGYGGLNCTSMRGKAGVE